MKKLNELERVDELDAFDAFEIIDLEEKLDFKPWIVINGEECNNCSVKPL